MCDTIDKYITYKEDVLVAFSGGFDSFAMLFKLLEMKKYNVHLFYYELENEYDGCLLIQQGGKHEK